MIRKLIIIWGIGAMIASTGLRYWHHEHQQQIRRGGIACLDVERHRTFC